METNITAMIKIEEDMKRQAILERVGWTFARIRGSKFFRNPDEAMSDAVKKLEAMEIPPEALQKTDYQNCEVENSELLNRVKARAEEIRNLWNTSEMDSTTVSQPVSVVSSAAVSLEIPKEDSQVLVDAKVNKHEEKISSKTKISKEIKYKPKRKQPFKAPLNKHALSNKESNPKDHSKHQEEEQISLFDNTEESNSDVIKLDNLGVEGIISFLKKQKLKVTDKRGNGGCLWLIGGKELSTIISDMARRV